MWYRCLGSKHWQYVFDMLLWFDSFAVQHSLPNSYTSCSIRTSQNPEHHQDHQKVQQKVFSWQEYLYWHSWNRVRTFEWKKDSSVQRNHYITPIWRTTFWGFFVWNFPFYLPSPFRQLSTENIDGELDTTGILPLMYYPVVAALWSRKSPAEVEQDSYLRGSFISVEGL